MNRIAGPQRELRNKTLQDGLKAYVVKPIKNCYQVISLRALWGSTEEDKVKAIISGKRRELEMSFERSGCVVFYVSCIQSFEKRSCAEKKAENTESLSENHETPPDAQEKEYHPSLAFWIAVTEGDMETMKALLMRQILASGMDIFDIRKIESRGKDKDSLDLYAKTLGNVLKDHKHFSAVNLSKRSTSYLVNCAAEVEGHDIDMDSHLPASTEFTSKPVTICFTSAIHNDVAVAVVDGLRVLNQKVMQLDYCLRDLRENCEKESSIPYRSDSKFTQAVHYVIRSMKRNGYCFVDGKVYVKLKDAVYSYLYCGTSRQLLTAMMSDLEAAELLHQVIGRLVLLMEQPGCKMFQTMIIDHNFIEALPSGTCYNM